MDYTKVILSVEEALKRRCTVCGASANKKCKTSTGQVMETLVHEYRKWKYVSKAAKGMREPGNSGP